MDAAGQDPVLLQGGAGGARGGAAGGAAAAGRRRLSHRQGEVGLSGRGRLASGAALLSVALAVFVLRPTPAADGIGAWMAADGVEPRYETVDGLRLRYVRKGSGPPLLLLHGFSSSI